MANDGSLKFDVKIDESGFNTGIAAMGSIAKQGLGVLTGNLMTAAVGKLVDLGKAAIGVGSSFEAASSQLAATMGTNTDSIQELLDKAKELGATTSFSATEAAEGLNILAQSGLSAEQQLADIGPVLDLAAAGSLSLASAAAYTEGALKGFVSESKNAQYYTDLMAKGATLANTNVQAFGEAMSDAAASADTYGQSSTETAVALLRLAEQNETGSAAATALAAAMKNLYSPTDTASKALQKLGVDAYDTSGKAKDFNTVIDELDAALSAYSDKDRASLEDAIFGIQGKDAFDKMIKSSGDKVESFYDGLASAGGSASQQAETMLDNLQGRLTIFQSAAEGFGVAIYEGISGPLKNLVDVGTDALSQLTEAFNAGGIEGMIEAGGNIVANLIAGIISGIPGFLEIAFNVVESFVTGFGSALPKILSAGYDLIAYLVDGVVNGLPRLLASGTDSISGFLSAVSDKLPEALTKGTELIQKLVSGITDNLPQFVSAAGLIISSFADMVMSSLPIIVDAGFDIIENLIDGFSSGIPNVLPKALEFIQGIGDSLAAAAPGLIQRGYEILSKLVEGIISALPILIQQVPQIVSTFANIINDNFPTILAKGAELLMQLISGIISAIPVLIENAPQIISAIVDVITAYNWLALGGNIITFFQQGISSMVGAVQGAGKNIFNALKGAISNLPNTLMNLGKNAISKMGSGITTMRSSIVSAGGNILNAIKGAVASLPSALFNIGKSAISQIGSAILSGISGVVGNAKSLVKQIMSAFTSGNWGDIGKNIISGIAHGLTASAGKIVDAAKSAAKKALDSAKNFLGIKSPSRVFRDQVGKMMALGMAEGFETNIDTASMKASLDDAVNRLRKETDNIGKSGDKPGISSGTYQNYNNNTVINQTVNINQPTKSPVETAREVRKAGRMLAYV